MKAIYNFLRKNEANIPRSIYFALLRATSKCKKCYDGYFMPTIGTKCIDDIKHCVIHEDGMITTYCRNQKCEYSKVNQLKKELNFLQKETDWRNSYGGDSYPQYIKTGTQDLIRLKKSWGSRK